MSYETARIAGRIGPLSMSGPPPERRVHVPENEAAYAGAFLALRIKERSKPSAVAARPEPHRKGPPRKPDVVKVLHQLDWHGAMTRTVLGERTKLGARDLAAALAEMRAAGLIEDRPAPLRHHPRNVVLALTPAGRAKAEAAR